MVEIIPQKEKKLPSLEKILTPFLFLILFLSIFSSLFLFFSERNLKIKIEKTKEEIEQLKTFQENYKETLKELEKISFFSKLVSNHFFPSKFFKILEEKTHSKVFFSKIDIDFDKSKFFLFGHTQNFYILSQQEEIFNGEENWKSKLDQISLDKNGEVDFRFEINFNNQILK